MSRSSWNTASPQQPGERSGSEESSVDEEALEEIISEARQERQRHGERTLAAAIRDGGEG